MMESSTRTARLAGMLVLAGLAGGCTTSMRPLAYTPIDYTPISEIQPGPGLVTENGEFRLFSTRSGPGGLKDFGQKKKDYADMSPAEAARQAAIAAQEAAAAAKRAAEAAARAAALAAG